MIQIIFQMGWNHQLNAGLGVFSKHIHLRQPLENFKTSTELGGVFLNMFFS